MAARKVFAEIPVAPIRKHIQNWIDSHDWDGWVEAKQGRTSPMQRFCEIVWPDSPVDHSARNLYRILKGETEMMHFDLADRIICAGLGDAGLWMSDPELREAYLTVDLRRLDACRPTSRGAELEIARKVRDSFQRNGSVRKVSEEVGIAAERVSAILKNNPEPVAA